MFVRSNVTNVRKSKYAQNAGQIVLGNAIGQSISLISMPIQSRLYGPSLFGEYGVFSATANLVSGLVSLGLVSAIPSPREEEEATDIYRLCIVSACALTTILIGTSIALTPYFRIMNVNTNYLLMLAMLGAFLVANTWATAAYTLALRRGAYTLLRLNPMIASGVNLLGAVAFALAGFASLGLPAAAIISQAAILVHLLNGLRPRRASLRARNYVSLLRKYREFPIFQMPSNLLRGLGAQMPILVISSFYGSSFLGHYSIAQRLLYVPITLVGGAMGQVHFQRSSELLHREESIGPLTSRVVRAIMTLVLVPLALVGVFGRILLTALLGPEWALAGVIAQIRTIEFLFTCAMFSVSYVFVVLKKQKVNLIYSVTTLILNAVVVLFAETTNSGGLTFVIALSALSALLNWAFVVAALHYVGVPLRRFVTLSLAATAILAACVISSLLVGGSI